MTLSPAPPTPEPPAPAKPIRVMVVDDHALFRRGLMSVLDDENDIDVVGEAGDGDEAVQRAETSRPDVIIMDVWMPHSTGIEAAPRIRAAVPGVKFVMLTMSEDQSDLFEALKAGASGYLLKDVAVTDMAGVVRSIAAGRTSVHAGMAAKLITEFAELAKQDSGPAEKMVLPQLTGRESEVLRLVAQSMNNREIGERLFITENTVKNHVRNILEKLQVHSRTEAAIYAVRAGY
ncbi:response regulator transcription factor [Nocardiopsis nanhaiensis]